MSNLHASLNAQTHVNEYFQTHASHWNDIYDGSVGDVWSQVHRDRHRMTLAWVDNLALAPGARVLDVGCGAGRLSVDLARRGLRVVAIDSTEAMVAQTREHAAQAGFGADVLTVEIGDATALAFADGAFDLVIALGVVPWLEDPQRAVSEMARVTRDGGYLLVTTDNVARLHSFFDPWLNPATAQLKRFAKATLARAGLYHPSGRSLGARLHSARFTDAALVSAHLTKLRGATVGFGPFTFFRRGILPISYGIALHRRLQRLADRHVPVLRATGSQYVVLARKP